MKEVHYKWFSQSVERDFDMLIFGERGLPMVLFATSQGRYFQNRDFGLIEAMAPFIENGSLKVYCPDSYDNESFYNYGIQPGERVRGHLAFERLIVSEVLELARCETQCPKAMVAGCSFGGYHALNFALKHPWLVSHMISLAGSYEIKSHIFGYYDDNCYFNDPVEYLPRLEDPAYLEEFRKIKIVLGTGEHDMCRHESLNISRVLTAKGVPHLLDDRRGAYHDWPSWKEQMYDYLTSFFGPPSNKSTVNGYSLKKP